LYTIFYLKKLKVLDGVPVDSAEQLKARDKYAGRITDEWLEEHLGHRDFGQVSRLEVPNAFIRECNCLCDGRFEVLQQLVLDHNSIWDLRMFEHLPQLMVLRLNHNKVGTPPSKNHDGEEVTLTGFRQGSLRMLEALHLEHNHISNMAALQLWHLENLRSLYLGNNEVSKLEGINHLQHLREINLNRNRIKAVDDDAFYGMSSVRSLSIEENGLKSLAHFEHLTFLHSLHLTTNRIADFSDIDRISGIRTLLDICIINNPICRKAFYRISIIKRITSLQLIDGKGIAWDERERAEASAVDPRSTHHSNHHSSMSTHQHPQVRVADMTRSSMYPSIVQDPRTRQQQGSHRVPVKVTSVTFECIGGVRNEDPGMLAVGGKNGGGPGPGPEMPVSREQQQQMLAAGGREAYHPVGGGGVVVGGGGGPDEFFLPTVGGGERRSLPDNRKRASSEAHPGETQSLGQRRELKQQAGGRPRSTLVAGAMQQQGGDTRPGIASAGTAGGGAVGGTGARSGFQKMYPESHKGGRVALNRPANRSTPRQGSQGRNAFGSM